MAAGTIRRVLCAALATLLASCSSGPVRSVQTTVQGLFQPKAEQQLAAGLKLYEDGKYPESARSLQAALDQGLAAADQVKARKHLAFMHCIAGRGAQCRDEFRKALEVDPGLELTPAEAGHPGWGPVFRSVKSRR